MSFALVQISPFEVLKTFAADAPPEPMLWPDGTATHATMPGFVHGPWMLAKTLHTPSSPGDLYTLSASTPSLEGETIVYQQTWELPPLTSVQAILLEKVETAAEECRQRHTPMSPVMAVVCARKFAEADVYARTSSPDPKDFPLLNAAVGIHAETLGQVAMLTSAAHADWVSGIAKIEAVRLQSRLAISKAATPADAIQIFKAIAWPSFEAAAAPP